MEDKRVEAKKATTKRTKVKIYRLFLWPYHLNRFASIVMF